LDRGTIAGTHYGQGDQLEKGKGGSLEGKIVDGLKSGKKQRGALGKFRLSGRMKELVKRKGERTRGESSPVQRNYPL